MRAVSSAAVSLGLISAVVAGGELSAHRRDELLQMARLDLRPRSVALELDLTPGIAVAEAVIADLDVDRDGVLSPDEKRGYVGRVLGALELAADGRSLHAEPIASSFPDLDAVRRGEGTIHVRLSAVLPDLPSGAHRLLFRNTYRPDVSAYLANALVPESDRISIAAQRRDGEQRDLTIDYAVRAGGSASRPFWLLGMMAGAAVAALLMGSSSRARRAAGRSSEPSEQGTNRSEQTDSL